MYPEGIYNILLLGSLPNYPIIPLSNKQNAYLSLPSKLAKLCCLHRDFHQLHFLLPTQLYKSNRNCTFYQSQERTLKFYLFFWYLFTFILIYGLQIKNGKAMRKEKATITFNIVVLFYCDLLCAIFHYNTSPMSLQLLLTISSLIHFLVSQVLNLESAIDFSLSTKYLISFYILQFSLHRLAHIVLPFPL